MSTQASMAQRILLAQETRKRFLAEAGRAMVELGVVARQRLTELMNEAAPSRDMQNRRDAWTLYQSCQTGWVEGTLTAWQAALKAPAAASKRASDGDLELVGTDVVEDKIMASRLVLSVMENVSAELNDLRVRIKLLEGAQDLQDHDIFRPEVLLLLMIEQWSLAGMPREAWPLVNEVASTLLTQRINQAYANANALLIRQGVLPTIELKDRVRRIPSAAPRSGPSPMPSPASGRGAPEGGASRRAAQAGSDTGGGSERGHVSGGAPSGHARSQSAGFFGSASEETRMLTSSTPLARARSRAQGVLGQLKRLLLGSGAGDFEATHYEPPSPALAAAIAMRSQPAGVYSGAGTVLDEDSPAAVVRVAGELRRTTTDLKNKAETKSEKAIIEIVALMFQAILQEERIPPSIRVWFARLQMPVLRLALAEPDFFSTLTHPARELIDRMGSCVMGFDASGISGSALETEIKRVVQVIEQYPETGRRVYQLVYDEFQKFLAKFLTGRASTQKAVSVAQQVEQKETLTIQYTIEMRNMLKDMPVRDEIREFLFKVWAEVLAVAAVRKGPQHADTLAFKKTATDLLWAASAKPNRNDRARVIADLPQLLQKLRAGMTLLGVAPSEQQRHIQTVSDTLADAFLSKTQAIGSEQIAAMAEHLAHLENFVTDDGLGDLPLDAHSIEMMLGIDASAMDVVTDGGSQPSAAMLAWAQELQVGAWFSLDHNGQLAQVQFAWRSDRKHLHLFASTTGHCYLMQTGRLAAYLQAGLLLPQEEETLTVRATRDALGKLEANPERLLG
ncbi:DUF1631 family protein [Rhodoferax ferrireducens]|uniref:DUF1631 family protein n=1 Tax=Rhodoferax ferrireducens TaxID=192843 RepID=UPI00298E064C|nr:DUF1631 family protein [Rhodoferax ferrireducens]WPC66642.1 DUF1631 family protein [Rhodoferax ferrireducens]